MHAAQPGYLTASVCACALQDSLAAWAAALLEGFPTLTRLHLNHNSDAAASRVASRAVTPRWAVPSCPTARTVHASAVHHTGTPLSLHPTPTASHGIRPAVARVGVPA